MSARRPCDACGGTGEPVCSWCSQGIRYVTDFGCTDSAHWPDTVCIVCQGRGWQSDAMPVSDALADAETLRAFCDANLYSHDFPLFSSYPLIAIWKCGNSGWTRRSINRGREHEAWSRAESQARAAFRAVPGLREEMSK